MKLLLLLFLICIQSIVYSQIAFEEVTGPEDFSLSAIRKSPTGEYFVQAANDDESIYTSLNGQDWIKTSLPVDHELNDIQFFSDGTPLLKVDDGEHLIRRNGIWNTMKITGSGYVSASFIKDDTLFAYQNETFAYSLDTGETFIPVFTTTESIIDHTANLFKLANIYVLHYSTGASNKLLAFNTSGERVRNISMDIGSYNVLSSCNLILFLSSSTYYIFREQDLIFEIGNTTTIIPDYSPGSDVFSQNGNYYLRTGNTVYRSNGCNFDWEPFATHDFINAYENVWITPHENVILFDNYSDMFIEDTIGAQWKETSLNIQYPYLIDIDESVKDSQILLSPGSLFKKSITDVEWMELDSTGGLNWDVQYSPNGDLYINRRSDILYSRDNGISFNTITLPDFNLSYKDYSMNVLDDDVIFIIGKYLRGYYYTLNNGTDWIEVNMPYSSISDAARVKLIDNYIIVTVFGYVSNAVYRINITTSEMETADMGDLSSWDFYGTVIMDDGTIFFIGDKFFSEHVSLFRFRFGEGLQNLGEFWELDNGSILETSGNYMYSFGSGDYSFYDGENMDNHEYTGLPITGRKKFIISENEYLYAIVDDTRIFRSTRPFYFNHQVGTNEADNLIQFGIYPNPSNSLLYLTLPDIDHHTIDQYEIMDYTGRIIHKSTFQNNNILSITHLTPGVYNLLLKTQERVVGMEFFVKQ